MKTALCGRSITSITPDVLKVFTLALLIVNTPFRFSDDVSNCSAYPILWVVFVSAYDVNVFWRNT